MHLVKKGTLNRNQTGQPDRTKAVFLNTLITAATCLDSRKVPKGQTDRTCNPESAALSAALCSATASLRCYFWAHLCTSGYTLRGATELVTKDVSTVFNHINLFNMQRFAKQSWVCSINICSQVIMFCLLVDAWPWSNPPVMCNKSEFPSPVCQIIGWGGPLWRDSCFILQLLQMKTHRTLVL